MIRRYGTAGFLGLGAHAERSCLQQIWDGGVVLCRVGSWGWWIRCGVRVGATAIAVAVAVTVAAAAGVHRTDRASERASK